MEIGVEVMKAMVRSLKAGHTDKVVETLETWLRIHEEVYGE